MSGWVKVYRELLDWRWISSHEHLAVFIHLLLRVNFKEKAWQFESLRPGQIVTGRKQLAALTGLSERKIRTILRDLSDSGEVTIKSKAKYSIITITNWDMYQDIDQQTTSKRPTNDQQTTTTKECKERKKERNNIYTPVEEELCSVDKISPHTSNCIAEHEEFGAGSRASKSSKEDEVIHLLNSMALKSFKTVEAHRKYIRARLGEGYTIDDFKTVIKSKYDEWGNDAEWAAYLRPSTLFGTKFDGYLQAAKNKPKTADELLLEVFAEGDLNVYPWARIDE